MKSILLLLITAFVTHATIAQLTITTGAQFAMTGPVRLTLQNTSLINNGSFDAGTSTVAFTGNGPNSIGGGEAIQFSEMEVNKSGNGFVLLLRPIGISEDLLFSAGFLNLNEFNIDLGTTGVIENENDSARVVGVSGGEVLLNVNLNAPALVNPGNLGLFITTTQNLGNVTIHRGHKPQLNNVGGASSIQRYFEIAAAGIADLNATLTFKYFDGELNNLAENSLLLFESSDAVNWTDLGFSRRNNVVNFVEKSNIATLHRFTLFNAIAPLPVRFIFIGARCESNAVVVNWKTALEQNIQRYSIERSEDGNTWTTIGQLLPGASGATETSYTYRDNVPLQTGHYRIAEYDLNGTKHYSRTVRTFCESPDVFTVFPNPVKDRLFINIVTAGNSSALIQLFDSKGALVKQQAENILRSANQLIVDMSGLAKGIYHLSIEWSNGQMKKTARVVKD